MGPLSIIQERALAFPSAKGQTVTEHTLHDFSGLLSEFHGICCNA
jgi:hypothetical protein